MTPFQRAWERVSGEPPATMRMTRLLHYPDIAEDVASGDWHKAELLVRSLWVGDVLVLKDAFDPTWLRTTIAMLQAWASEREPSFHQLLDGCPDFHRKIDSTATKAYSVEAVRHGFYFFRHNDDPLGLFPTIDPVWRTLKTIGGCDPGAFEQNKPSDGVIDRLIFYRYPRGGGCLGAHVDPTNHHQIIMGGMMSARGREFRSGGIWFRDDFGRNADIESCLSVGDMVIAYPTITHGVSPVDADQPLDWEDGGRWFLGLSSVDSDHVSERVTAARVAA